MADDNVPRARIDVGDADRDLADLLDDRIYEFNVAATGFADGRMLTIRATIHPQGLVGGLSGWTWGGCGYVDTLWVDSVHRRRGLGSRLLDAAEDEAVERGCVTMALSTHTFQAPEFYAQCGYVEIGRTEGYPSGHAQVHLRKDLSAA